MHSVLSNAQLKKIEKKNNNDINVGVIQLKYYNNKYYSLIFKYYNKIK